MRTFTLKKLFLTAVFFLLGSIAIHAADEEDLITEQVTIKLDKPGTLPDKIGDSEKYKITNLKVIGDINGTDFRLIRGMAGCDYQGKETNGKLSILDLSETNIVRGGEPYIAISDDNLYTENNKIGNNTFTSCNKLTSINLPSNVTTIGFGAFASCNSLTSINIPSNVTIIEMNAFADCNSLISINIPSSVTRIDAGAFWGCCSLTSINIPANIRRINDNTFHGCSSLTSIDIPSSVTIIERDAFRGCI